MTLAGILRPHKIPRSDLKAVQSIYEKVEGRAERYELNLYVTGYDDDEPPAGAPLPAGAGAEGAGNPAAPMSPDPSTSR